MYRVLQNTTSKAAAASYSHHYYCTHRGALRKLASSSSSSSSCRTAASSSCSIAKQFSGSVCPKTCKTAMMMTTARNAPAGESLLLRDKTQIAPRVGRQQRTSTAQQRNSRRKQVLLFAPSVLWVERGRVRVCERLDVGVRTTRGACVTTRRREKETRSVANPDTRIHFSTRTRQINRFPCRGRCFFVDPSPSTTQTRVCLSVCAR